MAFRPPKQVPCSNSRSLFGLSESRDEAKPGFLEVDLVAHCGRRLQGGCLYTITLTDVASGWTECLPLLNRGREAVLAALQRARALFPFPILGLDTDNGGSLSMRKSLPIVCVSRLPLREDAPMRNGNSALWSKQMGSWCGR